MRAVYRLRFFPALNPNILINICSFFHTIMISSVFGYSDHEILLIWCSVYLPFFIKIESYDDDDHFSGGQVKFIGLSQPDCEWTCFCLNRLTKSLDMLSSLLSISRIAFEVSSKLPTDSLILNWFSDPWGVSVSLRKLSNQ